jgi:hypothetical protein
MGIAIDVDIAFASSDWIECWPASEKIVAESKNGRFRDAEKQQAHKPMIHKGLRNIPKFGNAESLDNQELTFPRRGKNK